MTPLHHLPSRGPGDSYHVIVESPRGSAIKWKWSAELGAMTLSRPLAVVLVQPCDSGFIPSTIGPDGDPVDALVVWELSSPTGAVIPCRLVGVARVEQRSKAGGRERNDRILALPLVAPRMADVKAWTDLPRRLLEELGQ